MIPFIIHRWLRGDRGIAPAGIGTTVHELHDGHTRFGLAVERGPVEQFVLEDSEEALADGVVVAVSDRSRVRGYASLAGLNVERDRAGL